MKKCPIESTHKRLGQSHYLWHQALSKYDDPEGFRTNVNALIESMRNVTFMLQSEHAAIPDFRPWYESWRLRMRENSIMLWLHDARTTIVHKSDLEIMSTARAVVHTNMDLVQFSREVPPSMRTEDISMLIADTLPEPYASHREDLVLSVQRAWIVADMPGHELLDTLAQAYQFLSDLVKDAHHRAGYKYETYEHDGENVRRIDNYLPCMVTTAETRTVRIDLATGSILRSADKIIQYSPSMVNVAKKRYKVFNSNHFPDNPFELAEFLLPTAKAILVRDRTHIRLMFIHGSDGWRLCNLVARDRAEKYSLIRRIAGDVRKLKADSIVEIAEVWCAPIHGDRLPYNPATAKDRKELLVISVATNKGLYRSYHTPFSRGILGSIKLGKTEREDGSMPPYLAPLCEVWGLPTPTPVEEEASKALHKDPTDT